MWQQIAEFTRDAGADGHRGLRSEIQGDAALDKNEVNHVDINIVSGGQDPALGFAQVLGSGPGVHLVTGGIELAIIVGIIGRDQ